MALACTGMLSSTREVRTVRALLFCAAAGHLNWSARADTELLLSHRGSFLHAKRPRGSYWTYMQETKRGIPGAALLSWDQAHAGFEQLGAIIS